MREFLRDVLTEMSLHGMINRSTLNSNSKYPMRWQRNKAVLFRCLELVAFTIKKKVISKYLRTERQRQEQQLRMQRIDWRQLLMRNCWNGKSS